MKKKAEDAWGPGRWAAVLTALLQWYENEKAKEDARRSQEANYDLTKYRPRPRGL